MINQNVAVKWHFVYTPIFVAHLTSNKLLFIKRIIVINRVEFNFVLCVFIDGAGRPSCWDTFDRIHNHVIDFLDIVV